MIIATRTITLGTIFAYAIGKEHRDMNLSNATEKHFKETNPHIKEWPHMVIRSVSDLIGFIVDFESFGDPEKDAHFVMQLK